MQECPAGTRRMLPAAQGKKRDGLHPCVCLFAAGPGGNVDDLSSAGSLLIGIWHAILTSRQISCFEKRLMREEDGREGDLHKGFWRSLQRH
jgi:hypothetical protein